MSRRYREAVRRTDFPLPDTWDRGGLEAVGFEGFVPLLNMELSRVPPRHGVYVVLRPYPERPHLFSEESPLTPYAVRELEQRWIPGAPVVYIGKAGSKKGLQERLRPYSRQRRNHSGGRSIWQLSDAADLLVCWRETPGLPPHLVEEDYLDEFKRVHLAQPFANVRKPKTP